MPFKKVFEVLGFRVDIEGHTDSAGPDTYNLSLSERRADEVPKYLVAPCLST